MTDEPIDWRDDDRVGQVDLELLAKGVRLVELRPRQIELRDRRLVHGLGVVDLLS